MGSASHLAKRRDVARHGIPVWLTLEDGREVDGVVGAAGDVSEQALIEMDGRHHGHVGQVGAPGVGIVGDDDIAVLEVREALDRQRRQLGSGRLGGR